MKYVLLSNEGYLYQRDDGRIYTHENEPDDTFLLTFNDFESAESFRQDLMMSKDYDWNLEVVTW